MDDAALHLVERLIVKPLEKRLDEVTEALKELLKEARRTNGRVTTLEYAREIEEKRRHARFTKLELFIAVLAGILCGATPGLLRLLGVG